MNTKDYYAGKDPKNPVRFAVYYKETIWERGYVTLEAAEDMANMMNKHAEHVRNLKTRNEVAK